LAIFVSFPHHLIMLDRRSRFLVVLLSIYLELQNFVAGSDAIEDLTKYVNPFIGTEGQGNLGTAIGAGNVFPGAALPFSVVKFGIDTTAFDWTNTDANAGYTPDGYGMNLFL
jgi:putative alpha-1,2-mannosidase